MSIVDIDEAGCIEPVLKEMNKDINGINYYVGDATIEEIPSKKYDCIYFSSFTPDEVRRERIRNKKIWKIPGMTTHYLNKLIWSKSVPFL